MSRMRAEKNEAASRDGYDIIICTLYGGNHFSTQKDEEGKGRGEGALILSVSHCTAVRKKKCSCAMLHRFFCSRFICHQGDVLPRYELNEVDIWRNTTYAETV